MITDRLSLEAQMEIPLQSHYRQIATLVVTYGTRGFSYV
jgi:hypothetical protein